MNNNLTRKITCADKCMLAVSNFGVYGCIASFILHGPILYTTYLGGSPQAIGTIGVIMGFFNAVNGLPIAHLADKGYLNSCVSVAFQLKLVVDAFHGLHLGFL